MIAETVAVLIVFGIGLLAGIGIGLTLARTAMEREARVLMAYMERSRSLPVSEHRTRSVGATYIPPEPRSDN